MGRGSMAKLCQKCSSGSNANKCIVCGERISGEGAIARICDTCGFGSKKTNALNVVNRYRYSEKAQLLCFAAGVPWVQKKTLVFFAEKGYNPLWT